MRCVTTLQLSKVRPVMVAGDTSMAANLRGDEGAGPLFDCFGFGGCVHCLLLFNPYAPILKKSISRLIFLENQSSIENQEFSIAVLFCPQAKTHRFNEFSIDFYETPKSRVEFSIEKIFSSIDFIKTVSALLDFPIDFFPTYIWNTGRF